MKIFALIIILTGSFELSAQNGYVKLKNDSVIIGYVKYYTTISEGQQGFEIWKTKKDKNPLRILKTSVWEYAIKKDTFRILQNFRPFEETNTYFDLVEAKLISRGKVDLYVIENYQNSNRISTYTGGGLIPAIIDESMGNFTYMYVVENSKSGYLRGLSSKKEKLMETLRDFFPDQYLEKYNELKEKITYKTIPSLVKLYNSK